MFYDDLGAPVEAPSAFSLPSFRCVLVLRLRAIEAEERYFLEKRNEFGSEVGIKHKYARPFFS
jgi:hypothetical protein